MSRTIPAGLAAHVKLEQTSLATCWVVWGKQGRTLRGTDHDVDLEIPPDGSPTSGLPGLYKSRANISGSSAKASADMSVDNMEVAGAFNREEPEIDLTVAEMEAGLFDRAPVAVFRCNWQDPSQGLLYVTHGWLGEISRDSDGTYTTEIRSLAQALSQNIGQTYAERCNVIQFGDARCKFDVASVTRTLEVVSVTNRKLFTANISGGAPNPPTILYGGYLTFTSGACADFSKEVKRCDVVSGVATIELWEEMPDDFEAGDAASIAPGCDRLAATCRDVYDNLLNFRGYGVFAPGKDAFLKGPTG